MLQSHDDHSISNGREYGTLQPTSDLYYLLREVNLPCAVTILRERDHDVFSLLQTDADKAKRLAEAVYLSRQEVSLVAALSLANDNEHVDTGGRASEALNSHECWRVFCDVMASDGQLQFSVPDAVITALNRELATAPCGCTPPPWSLRASPINSSARSTPSNSPDASSSSLCIAR